MESTADKTGQPIDGIISNLEDVHSDFNEITERNVMMFDLIQ